MARRRRIKWDHGDLFAVPLAGGSFGVVQAVDHWLPHWIYTAVTDRHLDALPAAEFTSAKPARLIALVAVSDDAFDFGDFPRVGRAPLLARRKDFANEKFARSGYVGAMSYTGGIIVAFLSGWHGLAPWNVYKDPEYFDKLLVPKVKRPLAIVMSGGS